MSHMITISRLHKAFGQKKVLRGIDLAVARGESLVIIGGSGTGKSVLLKCILGIMPADQGLVFVNGLNIEKNRADFLHDFGMLFQGGALFDSLPIWRNVAFKLLHGKGQNSPAHARELAIEKLRRVGLSPDTADLFPNELSGGMQKRAALARAIATDPNVIFFDEPTTGLDPIMSGVINELIRDISQELGATTMTITHDMESMRTIADRIAMLHEGRVEWTGTVDELDHSGNACVDQFVVGAAEGPIATLR